MTLNGALEFRNELFKSLPTLVGTLGALARMALRWRAGSRRLDPIMNRRNVSQKLAG